MQEQINTINSILFDPLPKIHHNDDFVTINELPFQYNRLQEIKVYAWDIIIQGKEFNYNVIHSPNYKHSLDGYQDAIYAQAMFNHLKWLSNLNEDLGKDKKLLELKWFKVGLLFANGEMDSLFEKHKSGDTPNFTAVARELGDKNLRPYISESYSGTNETDKNIFINKDKVEKILNYCKTNNINVLETFNERIKY